ncbi:hypothetical protein [Argonema galeatum]|uniref:hypothetical protein n=1 Tax=Argonema galeatum TaxID=2942762 RepID=UPI002012DF6B|nr:hypothetical protein [Argonema galeatum]MCL1464758.1 hypothetical protein [Argonema galeatum A003/A1]
MFSELLEGVNQNWSRGQVLGFLIGRGITEVELAAWLRPFGERLLATPEQHQELVRRIVLLGELRGGELGQVAGEIGRQISALIPPPPLSPINTDNVWRGEVIEASFVGDGLSVSEGKNRRDAENTEKKNSEVGEDAELL